MNTKKWIGSLMSVFLAIMTMVAVTSCTRDDVERDYSKMSYQEKVEIFGNQIISLNSGLEDFILCSQTFETTNYSELKSFAEAKKVYTDLIEAGENLVKVLEEQNKLHPYLKKNNTKTKGIGDDIADWVCWGVDNLIDMGTTALTVGLGVVKSVKDFIEEAINTVKKTEKQRNEDIKNGMNKDDAHLKAMEKLEDEQKELVKKATKWGFATVTGTGAALVAGTALSAASAPVLLSITGSAVVGTGVTWLCSWIADTTKAGEEIYYLTSGKTTIGGNLPMHFIPNGSTLAIKADGYAPVVIQDFKQPEAGYERHMDIDFVKIDEIGEKECRICVMDEPFKASSCEDIQFVNAVASPKHPAVGQSVIVTATLVPPIAGCEIHFHVIGTDGYEDSGTKISDEEGKAMFYIPGAAEDVFDKVTVRSCNGKQYIVSYTFK